MSSLLFSALLSCSQLFHLFSCHLRFSHSFFSAHLNSSLFSSSQLLSFSILRSLSLYSALSSSPLFSWSGRLNSSPSHLISYHLSLSQLPSDSLSSSQLFSARRSSCQLISAPLASSQLISALVSSSHLISALLTSSQLFSDHPQIISALSSLAQNLLQNRIPAPKPQKVRSWCPFKSKFKPPRCDLQAATCKRP